MLITLKKFNSLKWGEMLKIPCECKACKNTFYISKSLAKRGIKGSKKVDYCSRDCSKICCNKSRPDILLVCPECKCDFYKKASAHDQAVKRKYKFLFCSKGCSLNFYNKKRHENRKIFSCKDCGKELRIGKINCFHCKWVNFRKEYIKNWKLGLEKGWQGKTFKIHAEIRKFLFDKYQNKCCKCSWHTEHPITRKVPLEVNHIDGNPANCKEENLELICPNCHSLTVNFRNLNRNSPRRRRKSE